MGRVEEDKADVVFISAAKVFEEPNRLQRWVSKVRSFRAPLTFAIAEVFSGGRLESADQASAMIGKEANGEKDGTRIWILNSKEFDRFGKELALRREEMITRQHIVTARGQRGTTFTGKVFQILSADPRAPRNKSEQVGHSLVITASGTPEKTDLIVRALSTEEELIGGLPTVKTNCQVAARLQLPPMAEVLFVSERDGKPPLCTHISLRWK